MLDPCINCQICKGQTKKADCLAPYPNLRNIGNSRGGFAAVTSSRGWTPLEIMFYNQQVNLTYGRHSLPDVL